MFKSLRACLSLSKSSSICRSHFCFATVLNKMKKFWPLCNAILSQLGWYLSGSAVVHPMVAVGVNNIIVRKGKRRSSDEAFIWTISHLWPEDSHELLRLQPTTFLSPMLEIHLRSLKTDAHFVVAAAAVTSNAADTSKAAKWCRYFQCCQMLMLPMPPMQCCQCCQCCLCCLCYLCCPCCPCCPCCQCCLIA